jgi:hypothetical protein
MRYAADHVTCKGIIYFDEEADNIYDIMLQAAEQNLHM